MPNRGRIYPAGIAANSGDVYEGQEALFDIVGDWAGILGAAGGLNSISNPVLGVATGPLQVTIGGTGECVLPNLGGQQRLVKEVPVQAFSVPTNGAGANPRIDIIYGQAFEAGVDASTEQFQQSAGNPYTVLGPQTPPTFSNTSFAKAAQSAIYQYVEGLSNGSPGAAPAGWTALVQITIPAGATSITQGEIATMLPFAGSFFALTGLRIFPIDSYGAVHTGTTDDSAAVNAAINAAGANGGGLVWLGSGQIGLSQSVTVNHPGVTLWGMGPYATQFVQLAQASSGFPAMIVCVGSKNTLYHFSCLGYQNANPTGTLPATGASGTGWAVLFTGGTDHATCYDVVADSTYHGFGCAPNGSAAWSKVTVDQCRVLNPAGKFGFFVMGPGPAGGGAADHFIGRGLDVFSTDANFNSGLWTGFHCDGNVVNFSLTNCSTNNAANALRVTNLYSGAQDSTLIDVLKLSAISSKGQAGAGAAISFEYGNDAKLRASYVTNTLAALAPYAVRCYSTWGNGGTTFGGGIEITASWIVGNFGGGVGIDCKDVSLFNNRIQGNGQNAAQNGVDLLSNCTGGITIRGNKIGNVLPGGTATQTYGVDLSAVPNTADWIVIEGNELWGNINNGLHLPTPGFLGAHCRLKPNGGYWFAPDDVSGSLTTTTLVLNPMYGDGHIVIVPGSGSLTLATLTYPAGSAIVGAKTILSGTYTGAAPIMLPWPCGTQLALTYSGSLTSALAVSST